MKKSETRISDFCLPSAHLNQVFFLILSLLNGLGFHGLLLIGGKEAVVNLEGQGGEGGSVDFAVLRFFTWRGPAPVFILVPGIGLGELAVPGIEVLSIVKLGLGNI